MKFMIFLLLATANVYAQTTEKVSMTYFGNEGRNRVYLSCDYVERAAEDILDQLGATDIDVTCTGGLDYGYYTPVSVRASYSLATDAAAATIKSDFNSNCYFDTKFIDTVIRSSDRLSKTRSSGYCFNSESRYQYSVEIQ